MMNLFLERESIAELPIYPVRGNHDCMFDDMLIEPKLQEKYPTWVMDGLFDEKEFLIGPNGEKLALIQVDSCLFICDYILRGKHDLHLFDPRSRQVFLNKCKVGGEFDEPSR